MGVTSLMTVISNPIACSARMADSRPEPGLYANLHLAHAMRHRLTGGILGDLLRGKRRALA